MISIRKEIETSVTDEPNNILKKHTLAMLTADTWLLPYSREKAAYPLSMLQIINSGSVRRVDETYGDRNLICSCVLLKLICNTYCYRSF
jgi:glycine dehydrogenase